MESTIPPPAIRASPKSGVRVNDDQHTRVLALLLQEFQLVNEIPTETNCSSPNRVPSEISREDFALKIFREVLTWPRAELARRGCIPPFKRREEILEIL